MKFGFPLVYVALAVGAARADTMVCMTDAGVSTARPRSAITA